MKVQAIKTKMLYEPIKHQGDVFPCVPLRERANIRSEIQEFPITGDEVKGETDEWIPISACPNISCETNTFQVGF